jgi:pimeloyl-ACP methyl ester carboxylesterase
MKSRDDLIRQHDGYALASTTYLPDDREPSANIVFCHGWGGTKGVMAPQVAAAIVGAGPYAVTTFDFSGFGESEGPRGRLDPVRQQRDCRAVLSWMSMQFPAGASRSAIFGLSFGGAIATTVAALDRRVRALVAVGTFANGSEWLSSLRPYWQYFELLEEIEEDARQLTLGGSSRRVDPDWIFPRDPMAAAFNAKLLEEFPDRRFELDVASAGFIADLRPEQAAADITCPALFVHGAVDVTAPASHSERLAAASHGQVQLFEGVGHYDMYAPGNFERMCSAATDFYGAHLLG